MYFYTPMAHMRQWRIKNSSRDTRCPGCRSVHQTTSAVLGHASDQRKMTRGKSAHLGCPNRDTHTDREPLSSNRCFTTIEIVIWRQTVVSDALWDVRSLFFKYMLD